MIPLSGNEFNNRLFSLFKTAARFTYHGNKSTIQLLLGLLTVIKQCLLGINLGYDNGRWVYRRLSATDLIINFFQLSGVYILRAR